MGAKTIIPLNLPNEAIHRIIRKYSIEFVDLESIAKQENITERATRAVVEQYGLSQHGVPRSGSAKGVVVLRDPSNEFRANARFSIIGLGFTVRLGGWPDGIEFLIAPQSGKGESFHAKMVDGELIRDDGRYLYVYASGSYKWLER